MKRVLIINCSPVKNGATAEIVKNVFEQLSTRFITRQICIDDYQFSFCKGCRTCHTTAKCILQDDVQKMIGEFEWADVVVCVSPSYWADVPGQFKVFIDRCTPWCNTHTPYAKLSEGKQGYAIALRTGSSMRECLKVIESIEHFYGHLEIERSGHLGLCSVEYKEYVQLKKEEIQAFCRLIK